MGLIRLLLAIAVVSSHSEQILYFRFPSGSTAVDTFFMISGFYMALILDQKYSKLENGVWLFFTNRFLRLYPIYWITLLFTLAVCIAGYYLYDNAFLLSAYLNHAKEIPLAAYAVLVISNLIIFLQALVCFFDLAAGGIVWAGAVPGAVEGWRFLLVPQAWSIGLELSFYLAAPFVVRRSLRAVAALAAACFALRLLMNYVGLGVYPWDHRFFTNGFFFFLGGVLTYKLYRAYLKRFFSKPFAFGLLVACLAATIFFRYLPQSGLLTAAYVGLIFIATPFVFELTKRSKLDRWVGEFSYPAYLSHFLFVYVVKFYFDRHGLTTVWYGETVLAVTMLVSLLLLRFVSAPIDKIREDRLVNVAPADSERINASRHKGTVNADKQV